jgi:hypothetical protein
VIDALLRSSLPMPLGAMMDYLFRPKASLVAEHLVPLVDSLPVWNADVLRVGVHARTRAADGE